MWQKTAAFVRPGFLGRYLSVAGPPQATVWGIDRQCNAGLDYGRILMAWDVTFKGDDCGK